MVNKSEIINANKTEHDNISTIHEAGVAYYQNKNCRSRYVTEILNHVPEGPNVRVLEVGCGTGFMSQFMPNKVQYHGIDVSEGMIIETDKYIGPNRKFSCAKLEDLNVTDKYDLIYSMSVLHHIYDLTEFRGMILSHLKEGGIYMGLHEPVIPKKQDVWSFLDNTVAILNGSLMGHYHWSKRLIFCIAGYGRNEIDGEAKPWIDISKALRILKRKKLDQDQYDDNLVDYQLTINFSENLLKNFSVEKYRFYINDIGKMGPKNYLRAFLRNE